MSGEGLGWGLILFLWSYGSGAYIAFIEDDLYGWLSLNTVPPYAAYYFVSRWEEMMSRLVILIVGLVLLAGGGRMLESARSPEPAEEAERLTVSANRQDISLCHDRPNVCGAPRHGPSAVGLERKTTATESS